MSINYFRLFGKLFQIFWVEMENVLSWNFRLVLGLAKWFSAAEWSEAVLAKASEVHADKAVHALLVLVLSLPSCTTCDECNTLLEASTILAVIFFYNWDSNYKLWVGVLFQFRVLELFACLIIMQLLCSIILSTVYFQLGLYWTYYFLLNAYCANENSASQTAPGVITMELPVGSVVLLHSGTKVIARNQTSSSYKGKCWFAWHMIPGTLFVEIYSYWSWQWSFKKISMIPQIECVNSFNISYLCHIILCGCCIRWGKLPGYHYPIIPLLLKNLTVCCVLLFTWLFVFF